MIRCLRSYKFYVSGVRDLLRNALSKTTLFRLSCVILFLPLFTLGKTKPVHSTTVPKHRHLNAIRVPGSGWALEQAKQNLVNHYLVVGITEEIHEFIAVLESSLPRFFKGATQAYNSGTVTIQYIFAISQEKNE